MTYKCLKLAFDHEINLILCLYNKIEVIDVIYIKWQYKVSYFNAGKDKYKYYTR